MHTCTHTHIHSNSAGWQVRVVTNYKQMWTSRRFQVSESNLLHACVKPTCKRQCWKILVHSSGSVLWHINSAQGSFKASCNAKRGEKTNRKVRREAFWNVRLVSVFTVSDLFLGLYSTFLEYHCIRHSWLEFIQSQQAPFSHYRCVCMHQAATCGAIAHALNLHYF